MARRTLSIPWTRATLALVLATAACSDDVKDLGIDTGMASPTDPTDGAPADTETDPGTVPNTIPEEEDSEPRLTPAQTDVFVFIANPERNTVTRVHVATHELLTVEVGVDPNLVLTTPDYATAVVFNRGDDTVSLLDAATLAERVVEVRQDLNSMALSPDGRFAVLWHDSSAELPDDPIPSGSQSFNEVSFVEIATGAHYPMAVGFDPHGVEFTPDSALAVVVADDSLALVDLNVLPLLPEMIPLSTELDPPRAEELVLSDDGSWGFLRQFGATELLVVDLKGRGLDPVVVGANPTDLDLLPDGSGAVALSRDSRELWVYDLANPFGAPRVLPLPGTAPYGQLVLSPRGDQAVLYTNAMLVDTLAVWDLATDTISEKRLVKPIDSVVITPTGESALVFHTEEDILTTEEPFLGEWAITLVDLDDFRTNPLLLPAEPTGFANSTNGLWGYFVMETEPWLEVLRYDTLLYDQIALPSLPVFVGVMPDLAPTDADEPPAWVSQQHDLGRIGLYDADEGAIETITGFELNSGIE